MALQPTISRRQRELVDTCFEEQLYDGGLGVLDRIRNPYALPSPQHIRQLLYLALYPPVTDWKEIKKQAVKKSGREKKQVSEIPPPERALVGLSLDTLHHFLRTNDAQELLRSIPSYERPLEDESETQVGSGLAYHAICITRAKHCWEILKPDYILPEGCSPIPSKRSQLVADHAWGVFDWLVDAFERDGSKTGGVSSMLVEQLPKSSGGAKGMISIPLDIIVASFSEPFDQRRIDGGAKLLTLLIALAKATPPLLSPDRLLSETCRRLEGMSVTSFSTFLTKLDDPHFKHALACAYISQHSEKTSKFAPPKGGSGRSRLTPQPTPRPPNKETGPEVRASSAYAIQPVERVLEILRSGPRIREDLAGGEEEDEEDGKESAHAVSAGDQRLKYATMKLHLLGSIGRSGAIQDEPWRAAVKEGMMEKSISIGFILGDGPDERASGIGSTATAFGEYWSTCL